MSDCDRASTVSRASNRSVDSVSSAIIMTRAKKAALQVKQRQATKRAELEQQRVRLNLELEQHDLAVEIAAADAEESALQEALEDSQLPTGDVRIDAQQVGPTPLEDPILRMTDNASVPEAIPANRILPVPEVQSAGSSSNSKTLEDNFTQIAELAAFSSLPKVEIIPFDSDPKHFVAFMANFKVAIEGKVQDNSVRLNYLLQFCLGDARKLIEHCVVLGDKGYSTALQLLRDRYGAPHVVARTYIDGLTKGSVIKSHDTEGLVSFSDDLVRCGTILNSLGYFSDLNNSHTLRTIVSRLPTPLRAKWAEFAHNLQKRGKEPEFSDLCSFVKDRAEVASSMFGKLVSSEVLPRARNKESKGKNPKTVFTTKDNFECIAPSVSTKPRKCLLCSGEHVLSECSEFKSMPYAERVNFIKQNRLCFNCLIRNHNSRDCRKRPQCPKCKTKHHALVHFEKLKSEVPDPQGKREDSSIVTCANRSHQKVCLRILPVVVRGPNTSVETYALLDEGSNVTLCTENLLSRLHIQGSKTSFRMTTVTDTVTKESSVAPLTISSLDRKNSVYVDEVLSVETLPVSIDSMIDRESISNFSHLRDLSFPTIDSTKVELLIGGNVPEVFFVEEQRLGGRKEPYGVKSILGWSLLGPVGSSSDSHLTEVNFQKVDLFEQVEKMWKTDFYDSIFDNKAGKSVEDHQALKIFETSSVHDGERYHISLPWRDETSKLENNISMALRRLQALKRRLLNDVNLYEGYCKTIDQYISMGHAERVGTIEEIADERDSWFLPHHAVVSPKKPGKVRVVFDCAAKFKNTSLNDVLLQGPDLVNSLVGVLMKFRSDQFAFSADIEAMFHQVRISDQDKRYFRFLWWNDGNLSKQPDVYCMNVHIFGATSSPSACSFALQKTAKDFAESFSPEAVSTVLENFYVDDCLKSVDSPEKGIQLVSELQSLLSKGGFNLTKFISNNMDILNSIPDDHKLPSVMNVKLDNDLPSHNVLGLIWNIQDDSFSYSFKKSEIPFTRRGVLSVASSLFDPLGFLAPVSLVPKLILQDLCRGGFDWDDVIPDNARLKMEKWIHSLSSIETFRVSRCLKPLALASQFTCELHHFCDASEVAYGVASYIRIFDEEGNSKCSLVAGKSRLAPLKTVTIPRLELSAAVVAVRVHQTILREINLEIHQSFFWTDSEAVLRYIRNKTSRFKTFVANRLAVIHDITIPSQWNYIPSAENPADLASRGIYPDEAFKLDRWIQGPDFLRSVSCSIPIQPVIDELDENSDEIKSSFATVQSKDNVNIMKLVHSISSFERLLKAFAWLLRYKAYCIKNYLHRGEVKTSKFLSVSEMKLAEKEILKFVQRETFSNEISCLASDHDVSKDSRLKNLCPILFDDLLCVGGRLQFSKLSYENMHPIILPSHHHVTDLIIRRCHEKNGHVGTQQVLNYLRERYWIVRGLSSVKRVINKCFQCRRNFRIPVPQRMANLPLERVDSNKTPFSYVGVDFFGPMYIRCNRSIVKRYGCLFTCFSCRAVHIEVSHSLTADSFLCCLSRFIARRGQPEVLFSDNGTNFVGAESELKACLRSFDKSKISNSLLLRGIEWRFTTPSSPHLGGVWERMIRSVKGVLRSIVGKQVLNDESLLTFLSEVERILNDRPLTTVSSDVRDPDVLTPSKILSLHSCSRPLVQSGKDISSLKKQWKQAQVNADIFWRRWTKEYLPILQHRSRWLRKRRNFRPGDVVLVVDDLQPRGKWPLGLVISVRAGRDGLVRTVEIRSQNNRKVVSVSRLCLLESDEEEKYL